MELSMFLTEQMTMIRFFTEQMIWTLVMYMTLVMLGKNAPDRWCHIQVKVTQTEALSFGWSWDYPPNPGSSL